MKLLTVLLAHFLVLAAACPTYEEYLNFNSNYTESTNQTLGPRWTEAVTPASSKRTRWPRDNNSKFTTISYCYANIDAWTNLKKPFTAAVKKWTDKIGQPGSDTQHALKILEVSGDGLVEQPFCFVQKDGQAILPLTWNPKIDEGALAIILSVTGPVMAGATMGYLGPGPDSPKVRNKLVINIGVQDPDPWSDAPADVESVRDLTHEIGHVIGLTHEHQRSDRDKYVNFDCKSLKGYASVKKAVEDQSVESRRGQGDTIEKVCEDPILAGAYGFRGVRQYSKTLVMTLRGEDQILDVNKGPFDLKSVMLYDSGTGREDVGKPGFETVTQFNVPIVMWLNPDPENPPTERTTGNCLYIDFNDDPSDGDRDAVRLLYPWPES